MFYWYSSKNSLQDRLNIGSETNHRQPALSIGVDEKIDTQQFLTRFLVPFVKNQRSTVAKTQTLRAAILCLAVWIKEGTRLFPQQFDSSTGHDQPFVPAELICILYPGFCLNVWWVSD